MDDTMNQSGFTESRLPPEAAAFYEKNGYYESHSLVLSQDQFARLHAIFEEVLENDGEKASTPYTSGILGFWSS